MGTRPTGLPGYVPSKPSATNSCRVRLFPHGVEKDYVFEGAEGTADLVARKLRWGHAGLLRLGRSVLRSRLPADRAIRCEQSGRVEAAQEGRLHAEQVRGQSYGVGRVVVVIKLDALLVWRSLVIPLRPL